MPVTLDDTRSSAKGNIVSGTAIQTAARAMMRGHALRGIRVRDAGTQARAAKPKAMRIGVIMIAGNDFSPSAMKKNDVPQMRPGVARRNQSVVVGCVAELTR
jgi:hypothetical protein